MAEFKVTRMVWLILLVAAAYCVPLLERNDLRNFVKFKVYDIEKLFEQEDRLKDGKKSKSGAILGTNFVEGRENNDNRLSDHTRDDILGQNSGGYFSNEAEDENTDESNKDSLTHFKDILDGILERVEPSNKDLGSVEKNFETRGDYNSVILDFIKLFNNGDSLTNSGSSFTETNTFNEQGTTENKQDVQVIKHAIDDAVIRNKLAEEHLTKVLQNSGIGEVNSNKIRTFLQTFGINLTSLKNQRTKRFTYDDGYVKEQPIWNVDLDRPFYISNDHLLETDLKEIYEKRGAECTMVHGYKRSPILSIARCPWNTAQTNVQSLCEDDVLISKQHNGDNEINLLHTPVQDINGFVYKNLYCAQCHGVKHPVAWTTALDCDDMMPFELSDGRDKVKIMNEYTDKNFGCKRTMRPVLLRMIHECDESEIRQQIGIRRHQTRIGNGRDDDYSPFPLSFSIFMNFGFDGKTHILFTTAPDEQFVTQVCPQGQMYDPVNNKCRYISCKAGYKLVENTCLRAESYESDTATADIASLNDIEETVQVSLTLKNISYGEIVLLTISSIEESLISDLAQQFNISSDRITNLTVSVVNASALGNNSDYDVVEIHRFTTPQPVNVLNRNMKEFVYPGATKSTFAAVLNKTNTPAYKVYTGAHRNQDDPDDSDSDDVLSLNDSSPDSMSDQSPKLPDTSRKIISNIPESNKTNSVQKTSVKHFGPGEVAQSEEPNLNHIWTDYPNVNVRITFLLKPAHNNRTLTEKSVKSVVQSMTDLISSNSFSITVNGTNFKVEELENPSSVTSMDLFCTKGQNAYISDDEFEVIRRYDAERHENLTLVKVNKTGQEFKPGEYDLTLMVHGTVGNISRAKVDSFVFVCIMPKITNAECSRITITESEYLILEDKSIEFAGDVYNFSQYEYEDVNKGIVQLCTPQEWRNVQTVINTTEAGLACGDDYLKIAIAESWLSFCLGIISLVFMLTALFTYVLFEKLRNLPGINTMNLTVSLFLEMLIFIASGYAKPHEAWLCSGVAMVLHYLILASFFWMNVMSYDVYRTFAKKCILTRIRSKNKFMPRYTAYAWASPLLIVVVCAIIDFSGNPDIKIGYGGQIRGTSPDVLNSQSLDENNTSATESGNTNHGHSIAIGCWIQEPVAAMVAFGVPMMLILLGNFIMFTRTIICIRASTRLTKMSVRRSSLSHMTGHDDVMLYIRMSTVMGFTWIFALASGTVSAFSKSASRTICITLHLLQILFIIFNCSQGIFIFIAFICNRRVLTLYKGLWLRFKDRGGRQRPLSSCSSNNTLNTRISSQTSLSSIINIRF